MYLLSIIMFVTKKDATHEMEFMKFVSPLEHDQQNRICANFCLLQTQDWYYFAMEY